jgi:hypothetical protein
MLFAIHVSRINQRAVECNYSLHQAATAGRAALVIYGGRPGSRRCPVMIAGITGYRQHRKKPND